MIKYMTSNSVKEGFILAHISEGGGRRVYGGENMGFGSRESCVLVLNLHTFFSFLQIHFIMSVCLYVHMHADTHRGQKRVS